ncbi:MAG: hypothetical protein QM638_01135 [Nocardioides sp.]|uniref:hypothetical protein n=1 Tax=Nocardioides sp. TaxID=35761 RepID=UPI0039E46D77
MNEDLVLWFQKLMAQEFGAYTEEHHTQAAYYFASRLLDSPWLAEHDREVANSAVGKWLGREVANSAVGKWLGRLKEAVNDGIARAEELRTEGGEES